MPKSISLGNGNILVCLDKYAQVRDFYFPFVGLENHVGTHRFHKVGVWVDDRLSWLDDGSWSIDIDCGKETLSSNINAVNTELGINIIFNDVVYNEKNIFLRKVTVSNTTDQVRNIKLFFYQQFEISESHAGDTAYFDPSSHTMIHYKGRRVFLINAITEDGKHFDDYGAGLFGIEGKEGTYKDAEDGNLSKNPIEHGRVDSSIALTFQLKKGEGKTFYYWVTVSQLIEDVRDLNEYILKVSPEHILTTTQDFWRAWVNKQNFNFYKLSAEVVDLFKKSLFIMRSHMDNNGSVLASGDSDMLQYGRDTYSYMWPRDGALSALALDKAGDQYIAKRFFEFCNDVITEDGYFSHKYRPDKAMGSSWHPWVRDGKPELPIQEDETALVLYSLWNHYEKSRDLEFIEDLYNSLIKKSADFLVAYRDKKMGLPLPSYDLWEEKHGIHTFTASSVYGALISAGKFAKLLGKIKEASRYNSAAEEIKDSIVRYLYNKDRKMFYKMMNVVDGKIIYDDVIDMSSIYGIFKFRVLNIDDPMVLESIKTIEEEFCCKTPASGVPRYEGDLYYKLSPSSPSNPWFITTLWLAQYYIASAKKESDLEKAKEWMEWTVKNSLKSGILSEQINPYSGEQISAAPLTWSHSEFVITIIQYLEKLEAMGICKVCNPVKG